LAVAIIAIVWGVIPSIGILIETEPKAAAEALVPLAEPIVQTRKATVKSTKPSAMEATKSAAVEATHSAAMEPATAAMEPATAAVEPATAAVETPASAPAMLSVGEIWLAERGSAQQSSCDSCQSPSYPGPDSMFAYL
jgi:hypothetical protein